VLECVSGCSEFTEGCREYTSHNLVAVVKLLLYSDRHRVATFRGISGNLDKSGKSKTVRERSGKKQKVREESGGGVVRFG